MATRHWLSSALGAVVTTALGVMINVATDLQSNWLAWVAVGLLTLAGWAIGFGIARARPATRSRTDAPSEGATVQWHQSVSGNITAGRDVSVGGQPSGWVFVAVGCVVLFAVAVGLLADKLPIGNSNAAGRTAAPITSEVAQAGASPSSQAPRPPALAVAKAWPFVSGCPSVGAVAMPPGMGDIKDFHATKDIRGTLTSSGAGSWTRGTLYLDLSAVGDQTLEIINIQPHIDRRDLAPPAWIYVPDDGCGPSNSDRVFTFNLDAPKFTDKGLFVSDAGSPPGADMPAAPLGPDFTVTASRHARVRVNAASCRGNYEWRLDVQYVRPGGSDIEHFDVGPFQSYGVANHTTVYQGYQGPTGSVQVDSKSTLTGRDPILTESESADDFFKC